MLAKNTRVSVATVAVALITGLVVALWVALMPAPAQAQAGDELQLKRIECLDIEDGWPDDADEPVIKVDGKQVWSVPHMKNGDIVDLTGTDVPVSGADAQVQLWEVDTGHWPNDHDVLGQFKAEYNGGTEQTETINYNNGWAVYKITYVVNRPSTPDPTPTPTPTPTPQPTNAPPTIAPIKPAPGSKIHNRTPLIAAKVSDTETDLARSNIKLFVDSKSIRTFSYDAATDRLSYRSGKLAYSGHTVKVKATDASGLKGQKTWRFKVVKR